MGNEIDLTAGGYYAVIPYPVLSDPGLKPRTKLLYGEIVRLSSATGFCYASNKYLIMVCTCVDPSTGAVNTITERTLQSMLAELADRGHIAMDTGAIPSAPGKSKTGRRIFVGQGLLSKDLRGEENFTPRKNLHPGGEKNFTPYNISKNKRGKEPPTPKRGNAPAGVADIISAFVGDDDRLMEAFDGFFEMRKRKGKPLTTERAAHLLLAKLEKLSSSRSVQAEILDQSTERSWTTVYQLKDSSTEIESGDGKDRGDFL